jgi:predicted RNA-binding Zn-ribbon protein involved in translation (DUF1610 family)
MSTTPVLTSDIKKQTGRHGAYVCPECGSRYPGKFALGQHRQKQHDIPNDWVRRKQGGAPTTASEPASKRTAKISTLEIVERGGHFKCPECGEKFPLRRTLGVHRAAKHGVRGTSVAAQSYAVKRAATTHVNGHPATTAVKLVRGKYHCPECQAKHNDLQHLGLHRRTAHGIQGVFSFKHQARQKQKQLLLKGAQQNEYPASHETDNDPTYLPPPAQPASSNGAGRPRKAAWTEESLSGFVFAHVHSLIEDACRGREDSIPHVTQRISELLHLEVHGQAARAQRVGLLRRMS